MRPLVVYESMFGNTERIARAVADGLSETFEVTFADVNSMPPASGMDLIVAGGPTHAFGLSRPSTREQATRQGTVGSDAAGAGLREYLNCSPPLTDIPAVAFDTKVNKPRMPGSAAHKAQRQLRRLGCRIVLPAQSFFVSGTTGPLITGEEKRARDWGLALASAVMAAQHKV